MSVSAGAARAYSWPTSRQDSKAELPDQPADDHPPLPLRPADLAPAKPVGNPAGDRRLEPQNETYRVLSARGLTLGKFFDLAAASAALSQWAQAVAIVSRSAV